MSQVNPPSSGQNTALLNELLWAEIFRSTTEKSTWFKDKSLAPGRWALGYPALYILYRLLNEMRPKSILELGMGQSTRMIAQYAAHYKTVSHTIVEHDQEWIHFCTKTCKICERSHIVQLQRKYISFKEAEKVRIFDGFQDEFQEKSFDLICIDAPLGADMKDYARVDVLQLLPGILNKSFAIILDDYNRSGEQHTAQAMEEVLEASSIAYSKGVYSGLKNTLLICSLDNRFFTSL